MISKLNSAQKLLLNTWKGERVTIELINKEVHENVLIKDIDPFSMTFIIELEDRDRLIQMKTIFRMDKMKEAKVPATGIKDYGSVRS